MEPLEVPRHRGHSSVAPNDLVSKRLTAKASIEQDLQVVARPWIAVQVEAAVSAKDAVKLAKTWRHHREVCQQVALTKQGPQRNHGLCEVASVPDYLIKILLCL